MLMISVLSDREELVDHLSQHPEATVFRWEGDADLLGDREPGDEGTLLGRRFVIGEDGDVQVEALG